MWKIGIPRVSRHLVDACLKCAQSSTWPKNLVGPFFLNHFLESSKTSKTSNKAMRKASIWRCSLWQVSRLAEAFRTTGEASGEALGP